MIEIQAPYDLRSLPSPRMAPWVFLAGSIEGGVAEKWQEKVIHEMIGYNGTILNPRRDDWDASWEQSINNPQFKEQVDWELLGLESCDYIFMYLSPETKSPISLLELGLFATKKNFICCCPKEFWRRGNVEIVCSYHSNIYFEESLESGIENLKFNLAKYQI